MQNLRLAAVYAKSLVDLAQEYNQLEQVYKDVVFLREVFKASKDFKNIVSSPILAADKKWKIIAPVIEGNISELTSRFIHLLIKKDREENLQQILDAVKDRYNKINNIYEVKLTTASEISQATRQQFIDKLKTETNFSNIQLQTKIDPDIVGGFILEYQDKLVDASIKRDLNDVKKQFKTNHFESNIR